MINPYNNSQVSNRDSEDSEDDDENEEVMNNYNASGMEIKEDDEDLNNTIDNNIKNNSVKLIQEVNPRENTHNLPNSKVDQSQQPANNITPNSFKISSKDVTAKSDILTKTNNKTPNVKTQIKETTAFNLNSNNSNNNNETNVKEKDTFKKKNVNSNLPQQKPNLIQDNSIMNKADNKPHRLNKRAMLSDTNVQQYLNQDKIPNESDNTKVYKPRDKSIEKVLGKKMNENHAYDKKEKGYNFDNFI